MPTDDDLTPSRPIEEVLEDVYARASRIRRRRAARIEIIAAVTASAMALAAIGLTRSAAPVPAPTQAPRPAATVTLAPEPSQTLPASPEPSATAPPSSSGPKQTCRAPSSEIGVDDEEIMIGVPVTTIGVDAASYGDARHGITAAVEEVNGDGGVCGRRIRLHMVETANKPETGRRFIVDLARKSLALLGAPAPDSLAAAIEDGDVDGVPVVGTTGWHRAEFSSDWVWPVGPGPGTFARVAIDRGYDRGGRVFAIVYSGSDRAGRSARDAARDAVEAREGASLVEVDADDSEAGNEYDQACAVSGCDVSLTLTMSRASQWFAGEPSAPELWWGLSPHTLGKEFAEACREACNGALAWGGFDAPVDGPGEDVRRYKNAVHEVSESADAVNHFTEAGYAGALVLIDALEEIDGPITREALREALDARAYDTRLTAEPLDWPESRRANRWMRAYRLTYDDAGFDAFERATGWIEDPEA